MPNMDPKKCPMPSQEPNVRNKNFKEVALGYTEEMAVNEAPAAPAARLKLIFPASSSTSPRATLRPPTT